MPEQAESTARREGRFELAHLAATLPVKQQPWDSLPEGILGQIGHWLGRAAIPNGRLACRQWRRGLSLGVTQVRPRLPKPTSSELPTWRAALTGLPHLAPFCTKVDFSLCKVKPAVVPLLAEALASVTLFKLRIEFAVSKHKKKQVNKVEVLMAALRGLRPTQVVEVELQVTDRPFFWNNNLRDGDCLRIAGCTPRNVRFTNFNLAEHVTHNISGKGMHAIASLQTIRELVLITSSSWGADDSFRCVAQLTALERLVFGTGLPVSNWALVDAVAPLQALRSMTLMEFEAITDDGVEHLSHLHLPNLQELGLVCFEQLTDRSLEALARLTTLQRLDLMACFHITAQGLPHLNRLHQLSYLNLNACFSLGNAAVDKLVKAHPRPLLVCTRQGGILSSSGPIEVA